MIFAGFAVMWFVITWQKLQKKRQKLQAYAVWFMQFVWLMQFADLKFMRPIKCNFEVQFWSQAA